MKTILIYAIGMMSFFIGCKKNDPNVKTVEQGPSLQRSVFPSRSTNSTLVINVPFNGDIQAAIDQAAAAGGGTVNLASGTWSITTTIRIKSNITLSGSGNPATTLTSSTPITFIRSDADGLVNLTIQNLKIIGISSDSTSNGIMIPSLSTYFKNVKLQNVQVTNCGGMGVHIKRADTVNVISCNLHGNGKSFYYHNIYVRQSRNVNVANDTLNDSPHGSGLHIAGVCSNIVVSGNTVNNNGIAGLLIQDTPTTIQVLSNNLYGNGAQHMTGKGDGISFTGTDATIDGNTSNNNFEGGIHTWGGSGAITNNHALGNASNYNIHGTYTQSNNL